MITITDTASLLREALPSIDSPTFAGRLICYAMNPTEEYAGIVDHVNAWRDQQIGQALAPVAAIQPAGHQWDEFGRTNSGDETGGSVQRFGFDCTKLPVDIIPATNGAFVYYDDYLKLFKEPAASAPAQPATLLCWSCERPYTDAQRADADGHCPHCGSEIELDDNDYAAMAKALPAQPEAKGEAVASDLRIVMGAVSNAYIGQTGEHLDDAIAQEIAKAILAAPVPAAPADKGEFPPLPETRYNGCGDGSEPLYTPDMMHAYVLADRARQAATAQPSGAGARALAERWNAEAIKEGWAGDERAFELFDALAAAPQPPASSGAKQCTYPKCATAIGCTGPCSAPKMQASHSVPGKSIGDDAEFEVWWESHGQFCRAGGGDYEKTFAYRAWQAALIDAASKERGGDAEVNALDSALYDALVEPLGDLYTCGRVWSAWNVGTMSQDDFTIASEVDEIVSTFVQAARAAIATTKAAK